MTDPTCFECGNPAEHNHHVVPALLGGTKTVPLCVPCHDKAHQSRQLVLMAGAKARIRQELGRCEGRKPFGARIGEETTISRMLELRRRRYRGKAWSYSRIAKALDAEGLVTRYGQPWAPGTVFDVIRRQRRTRRPAAKRKAPDAVVNEQTPPGP